MDIVGIQVLPARKFCEFCRPRMSKYFLLFVGWLSIATPGEIHGYWTAYRKYGGAVEWKKLLQPTIELMEEGFLLTLCFGKAKVCISQIN